MMSYSLRMSRMARASSFLKNSRVSLGSRDNKAWRTPTSKPYMQKNTYLIMNTSQKLQFFHQSLHLILEVDATQSFLIQILIEKFIIVENSPKQSSIVALLLGPFTTTIHLRHKPLDIFLNTICITPSSEFINIVLQTSDLDFNFGPLASGVVHQFTGVGQFAGVLFFD
uniref:Uncharacterized protein n=1 Tax=Romanomermis culicivorax TaxID=13658 RepID=A0A915ISE8_ROMCU